jgi:hypothetical protein
MKRHLLALLSCLLLLAVTGCKEKKTPQSLKGNEARPTWTAPDEYDYSSSMTAVIRVDLAAQYPTQAADFTISEDDLLAAFAGNRCLGVTEPKDGLFYLFIAGPDTEEQTTDITLRYWSAHYTNLFVAENAFPFVNDEQKGTIAEPFVPALKLDR